MADVKWIKITTDMFEDEKIDFITSLPESDAIIVIWIRLLSLAGKCNAGGYLYLTERIPYTEDMLAHKFRKPINIIKLALETFKMLDMVECKEGIIFLTNWGKHQNIDGLEKIREQTAARVAKHRDKQRQLTGNTEDVTRDVTHVTKECNVTVTQGNATELDIELDKDIDNNIIIINAREEIEINVNESEESVSKTTHTVNELSETVSKTEENRPKDIGTKAVDWAEKNWGRMIPKGESDSILAWCDEFSSRGSKEPDAVVIEGMKCCLNADVRKVNYLSKILIDWREAGVLTVAQVEAREAKRLSQKENKRGNKDPGDKPPKPGKYDDFYL